ncbi:MAG: flagellar motor switch protein FliG [Methylococcaceae bacterium]
MSDKTGIEKAALLLLTLGPDRAAEILKLMSPTQVQTVGMTMASLDDVKSEEVDEVLEEFIETIKNQTSLGVDSDDYIRDMLIDALGEDKAGHVIDRIMIGRNSKGLEQLKWMEPRAISELIRFEHPQIIAVLLSLLDADLAAEVLTFIPANMHADILMRIATVEGVQPSALKELDAIMERQLSGSQNVQSSNVGGIDRVANILNFIEGSVANEIMEKIEETDAELNQQIQDKLFVFADLVGLDDRGTQALMREISTDQLMLALRGAEDSLKEKIFNNMSKRAADMLRDDLEAAPPVKVSEVEMAQKEILVVAKRLADSGEISLGGGGGDDLI